LVSLAKAAWPMLNANNKAPTIRIYFDVAIYSPRYFFGCLTALQTSHLSAVSMFCSKCLDPSTLSTIQSAFQQFNNLWTAIACASPVPIRFVALSHVEML
jgi:hypothetical protein